MYKIVFKSSAKKELHKLPRKVQKQLLKPLAQLGLDPYKKAEKLTVHDLYRVRCGSYRIVYSLKKNIVTVTIVRIGHRKDIYNKL